MIVAPPLGEGCLGHVEGGRDPDGAQRLRDLTTELVQLFESAFSDDLDAAFFGHLKCILPEDWLTPRAGLTAQERDAFDQGLVRKINEELEALALDRRLDGRSFTYYLVVETPATLTDAEQARRDKVLGRLKARFPQIAILCTAPNDHGASRATPDDEMSPRP